MSQPSNKPAEPIIRLSLPLSAVDVILAGLGELKAKEVGDLPHYIRGMALQQLQEAKAAEQALAVPEPQPAGE